MSSVSKGRPTLLTAPRLKPRKSAVEQALARMRRMILNDRFGEAGVLPSENALAQRLGVSRRIVREAIRGLEAQGLLEVTQGRRTRVRPPDAQAAVQALETLLLRSGTSIEHLIEARLLIEPQIAALASERASEAHLAEMEGAIQELGRARTFEQIVLADDEFHLRLARATGNPALAPLVRTLFALLRGPRRRDIAWGTVQFALDGHRAILAAIRGRNGHGARETMVEHIIGQRKRAAARAQRPPRESAR